jgi:phospholipid N-methyltransferase|tara:strand:- start:229 stop:417 length:189 start_codon:yes stop_codon:yes gene_type:complete
MCCSIDLPEKFGDFILGGVAIFGEPATIGALTPTSGLLGLDMAGRLKLVSTTINIDFNVSDT